MFWISCRQPSRGRCKMQQGDLKYRKLCWHRYSYIFDVQRSFISSLGCSCLTSPWFLRKWRFSYRILCLKWNISRIVERWPHIRRYRSNLRRRLKQFWFYQLGIQKQQRLLTSMQWHRQKSNDYKAVLYDHSLCLQKYHIYLGRN